MYTILANVTAKPNNEAKVIEIFTQLANEVRSKEKDCLMYLPHVSKRDQNEMVIFEKYKDEQAFKTHEESTHFQAAANKFKDLLQGKISVKLLEEI